MNLCFAQVNIVPTVPWPTISFVALGLLAIILIIASLLWAWNQFAEVRDRSSGKHRSLSIEPQPVSVSKTPKRYNHDLAESRHDEVSRRLDEHDVEIRRLDKALDEKVGDISAQLNAMPGKIVADILNTKKLFGGQND